MTNETKSVTLTANERVYLGSLVKRELDAVESRKNVAEAKAWMPLEIEQSLDLCKANLQHIYDMLSE